MLLILKTTRESAVNDNVFYQHMPDGTVFDLLFYPKYDVLNGTSTFSSINFHSVDRENW